MFCKISSLVIKKNTNNFCASNTSKFVKTLIFLNLK